MGPEGVSALSRHRGPCRPRGAGRDDAAGSGFPAEPCTLVCFSYFTGKRTAGSSSGVSGVSGGRIRAELLHSVSRPSRREGSHARARAANVCRCFHAVNPPAAPLRPRPRGELREAWVGTNDLAPFGGCHVGVSRLPEQVLGSPPGVGFENSDT